MLKTNIFFFICFIVSSCTMVTSELESSKKPFYSREEWIQLLHNIFPQDPETCKKIVTKQSLLDLADKPFDPILFTAVIQNVFCTHALSQKHDQLLERLLTPKYDDYLIELEKLNLYTQKEFRTEVPNCSLAITSPSQQAMQRCLDLNEIEQALLAMFSYVCNASLNTQDYACKDSEIIEKHCIHEISTTNRQRNMLVRRPDTISIKPIVGNACYCNFASNCAEFQCEESVCPKNFPQPIQQLLIKILKHAQTSSIADPLSNRSRSWYRGDRLYEIHYILTLDNDRDHKFPPAKLSSYDHQATKETKQFACRVVDNRAKDRKFSFLTKERIPLMKPIENYLDTTEDVEPFPQIIFTQSLRELSLKKSF